MIVLFDMDQVLCDWSKEMDKRLDVVDPERTFERCSTSKHFDLRVGKTQSQAELVQSVMDQPGFYKDLEPFPGAVRAYKEISEVHETFIVSSPTVTNPTCASDKTSWVIKHLGKGAANKLILTKDKTVVYGDVLIDDKPEIYGAIEPVWEHILVDNPWNRHVKTDLRLTDWEGLPSLLSEVRRRSFFSKLV